MHTSNLTTVHHKFSISGQSSSRTCPCLKAGLMDVTQMRNKNCDFRQKELLLGYEMASGLFGELNS